LRLIPIKGSVPEVVAIAAWRTDGATEMVRQFVESAATTEKSKLPQNREPKRSR